ncbi:hypothetical protein HDE_04370 [Halotydeus destructor]|nr:hypothetical protein HDE_04370 [Halotydeus destructor]
MKVVLISLAIVAAILVKTSHAQNAYKVNVFFDSSSKFKQDVEGKLKLHIYSGSSKILIPLSATTETFKKGSMKTYLITAPLTIQQVSQVSLEWSYKKSLTSPSTWLKSYKLYIDRVTLEPSYLNNANQQAAQLKGLCNSKRPKGIFAGDEVGFDRAC